MAERSARLAEDRPTPSALAMAMAMASRLCLVRRACGRVRCARGSRRWAGPPCQALPAEGFEATKGAFEDRAKQSGLIPPIGSVGGCYEIVTIESFWRRIPTERLDRRRWRTRNELEDAPANFASAGGTTFPESLPVPLFVVANDTDVPQLVLVIEIGGFVSGVGGRRWSSTGRPPGNDTRQAGRCGGSRVRKLNCCN